MDFDKKNKVGTSRESAFSRIEKMHPFMMMLYLSMMGIGILFLMLTIAYVQSSAVDTDATKFTFPRFFSISTILLLISGYTISKTNRSYKKDNLNKLKKYFLFTILLGVGFVLSQLSGWYEISSNGISFRGLATGTYIYLISALHAVHLIGGFIFLSFMYFKTQQAANDPIRTLLFIRNPFVQQQIRMLGIYWHFMDGLWVFLYLVFLFTMKS
ncbi:MAG: cytochrome c oxidase subunit III [Cytophagales bacterium CG18_big_fil_WC_8_21_14_2_50_42_9]|nr:MAG: cytochrome c oxidase subunit III [Cytophagales bacterium CG18_big_fil_WC_8_21_14_2_50_42_9]